MICVIDNYDSFTYNIVQIFLKHNYEVKVFKSDQLTISQIDDMLEQVRCFILSPGPGKPSEALLCHEIIRNYEHKRPILGVCLGHQVIAEYYGGEVGCAESIMHGKVAQVFHDGSSIYEAVPSPFQATRYNSLLVKKESFPEALVLTSWTKKDGQEWEVMGLRHKSLPIAGFQFHPESILSQHGERLIINFLTLFS